MRIDRRTWFVLSSAGVFIIGNIILTSVYILLVPKKDFSVFRSYLPSVVAMAVTLIYLMKVAGTKQLYFSAGKRSIIMIGIGIIAGCVLRLIITSVRPLDNPIVININALPGFGYFSAFLIICLVGPVFEELIFRGYIFEQLRLFYGCTIAWIMTLGLAIVIHHVGNSFEAGVLTILDTLIAISIITLVYQYGRLYASIAVHVFMNVQIFLNT